MACTSGCGHARPTHTTIMLRPTTYSYLKCSVRTLHNPLLSIVCESKTMDTISTLKSYTCECMGRNTIVNAQRNERLTLIPCVPSAEWHFRGERNKHHRHEGTTGSSRWHCRSSRAGAAPTPIEICSSFLFLSTILVVVNLITVLVGLLLPHSTTSRIFFEMPRYDT